MNHEPPAHLSDFAVLAWNRIVAECAAKRIDCSEDAAQMRGGLDRPLAEFQMELPRLRAQCVKDFLDLVRADSTAELDRRQPMVVVADQLPAIVAARVAGDFAFLITHSHLRRVGAEQGRLTDEMRRDRVAIAVEVHAGVRRDHHGHQFVRVVGSAGQRMQQAPFPLEAIHGPLVGRLVPTHISHLIPPGQGEGGIVFPTSQFLVAAGQRIAFDIPHASLHDPFRFGIPPGAGDGLQAEVAAQGEELGVQAGLPARTVQYGRFEVVENNLARTAAEELQRVHQGSIELGLTLREAEFEIAQAAVTQHRHEH